MAKQKKFEMLWGTKNALTLHNESCMLENRKVHTSRSKETTLFQLAEESKHFNPKEAK